MATLQYGIELEMNVPYGSYSRFGGGYSNQFPMPDGWTFRHDGSLRANSGMNAVELVSPILEGINGIQQIRLVCERLAAGGAKVNASCGLHVHTNAKQFTKEMVDSVRNMARVHEFALFGLNGTKIERRMISEHGRSYCKPSQYWHDSHNDRYRSLNTSNWYYAQSREDAVKNTVEFRCFAGTVDVEEVIAAVTMVRGLTNAMYKAYQNGNKEYLPTKDTPRDKLPLASMQNVITSYFGSETMTASGILLPAITKNTMLTQARKAERVLTTM